MNEEDNKKAAWVGFIPLLAVLGMMAWAWWATAADITPGYTFTTGEQNITHSKLNSATAGSINTTFFTDKTADTAPEASDLVLIYDNGSGVFKKVTLANLIFDNGLLISNRTEEAAANTNDFLLFFDTSASAYRKGTLNSLVFTNANLIAAASTATSAASGSHLAVHDGSKVVKVTKANYFADAGGLILFTNLSLPGSTMSTNFYVMMTSNGVNYRVSLDNALMNWGGEVNVLDTDYFVLKRAADLIPRIVEGSTIKDYVLADRNVIQTVTNVTATYTATTSVIPVDDTIPQNTEGTEILTLAITPTATTNELWIRATVPVANANNGGQTVVALFQDTTANALAATMKESASSSAHVNPCVIEHVMPAGTTSATTFKLRVGTYNATYNAYVNGHGARLFGGVSRVVFTIMEVKP
ncbi:MAG: hypothetical protein AB1705_08515 [Verrucomicrobiota bacterium]